MSACALAVGLSGCLAGRPGAGPAAPRPALDAYRLEPGEGRSAAGCRYDYRVFEPIGRPGPPDAAVMIGHGFLRDQDRQVGLARALANAGHRAITLDFCNMRPWNGHHLRNAADMRRLARTHGVPGRTVYAGFSAGALAALLAGAEDPDALGIVTLDLVDQADLGLRAARRTRTPLTGLAGPPSACNAQGNGREVFESGPMTPDAAPRSVELVPGATHCDFELPSNWLCELACGASPVPPEPASTPDGAAGAVPTRRELVIERTVELVERMVDAASDPPADGPAGP